MGSLFGTDGVRGVANTELTAELAYHLGLAGGHVLSKKKERPVFLIGKDTRVSGDMIENAISAGILSIGGDVIRTGVIPTPAVACLVKAFKADAGIVISASHNTYEYNGIKFFNGEGFKLDDLIEEEIEHIVTNRIDVNSHIFGDKVGRSVERAEEAHRRYCAFLTDCLDDETRARIRGMKLVIDAANGAAFRAAADVFSALGAETHMLADEPNGVNINAACGSTHPEILRERVTELGADLGLAFDGDADRLIAVDERGRIMDGDKIIYICAALMKERGELNGDTVTVTVMSNLGLTKALEAIGCKVCLTNVGDRYVLESMLQTGGILGGEQSGHIIFLNHGTTGDGILAALQLIRALRLHDRKASEAADAVTIYPQVLRNAVVKNENKSRYMRDAVVRAEIEKTEARMAGEGRVLIRPSGTEPFVRVMLEGRDLDEMQRMADGLAVIINQRLG